MKNITFIVPTYNNKRLLSRCLNSIKKQIGNRDEIIIVDDGSTDGTYDYFLNKYENYNNVLIVKQTNAGSGAARNKGVELTNTEYIWFVDSDDYLTPNSVKKVKTYLNMKSLDILYFDFYLNEIRETAWEKINIDTNDKISLMLSMHVPWNKVIKTKLFDQVKFPEGKIRYQDHGTLPILISKGREFDYIKEPLYVYDFSHPNNISNKIDKNDDMYVAFENLLLYYRKDILTKNELEVLILNTFVFSQIYNPSSNNLTSIYTNINKVKKYLNTIFPKWYKSKCLSKSFGEKYGDVVNNLKIKIIVAKALKKSTFIPAIAIYIYKKLIIN